MPNKTPDPARVPMNLYEYLCQKREKVPHWLAVFENGHSFQHQDFFGSRVVYYPGAGTDGHPVKLFGSTHSAHSFVYADYGITQDALRAELEHETRRFRGYHTLARLPLSEADLTPNGWEPHGGVGKSPSGRYQFAIPPFGFVEVLERDPELDDAHGAPRLAILFLGADGIAAYDALFCQRHSPLPPFAVLIHDHGTGGNYDRFGRGGLLEAIAIRQNVFPRYLLVAENTVAWTNFGLVRAVEGDPGGMHATPRVLYHKTQPGVDPTVVPPGAI